MEHLLTMRCGFEWEGPDDLLHTWGAALQSDNPVRFVLDQPMASEPRTQWVYNGACPYLEDGAPLQMLRRAYLPLRTSRKMLPSPYQHVLVFETHN